MARGKNAHFLSFCQPPHITYAKRLDKLLYHNLWYGIQVLETVPDHVLLAFSGREYN